MVQTPRYRPWSKVMNTQMRQAIEQMDGITLFDIRTLLEIGLLADGDGVTEITGRELARLLSTSPEQITRSVNRLSSKGYVKKDRDGRYCAARWLFLPMNNNPRRRSA